MKKKRIIIGVILAVVAVVYTILVAKVDVKAIGPENSEVGFASINGPIHEKLPYNETFYKISKYAGLLPFLFVAFYGLQGVMQLIKEKSFSGVDLRLYKLCAFYVMFAIIYVLFEKLAVNYRPVIIDAAEGLEASFPSTHTLLAICLCGSSLMIAKYYIKNETLLKVLNIATWALMLIIVIARIISGVHWASDILGGVIISLAMLTLLSAGVGETEEGKRAK